MQGFGQWLGISSSSSSSSSGGSSSALGSQGRATTTESGLPSSLSQLQGQQQRGVGGKLPGSSSIAGVNGDMRGRGSSTSVLGSGLGLGFGVAGGGTPGGPRVPSRLSATWAAVEKLAKPWLGVCKPLPPAAALVLLIGLFLLLSFSLLWVMQSLMSWLPRVTFFGPSAVASFSWSKPRNVFPLPELTNLIMVAGHSVYTSTSCEAFEAEKAWYLEPYQRVPGQAQTFLDHIRLGVKLAAADQKSLLLFSGGQTRKSAGPRSEGQSYWFIAEGSKWFGKEEVVNRALPEEYARDSFENLLFSICRFKELTGQYPQNITVVSYDFKQQRFMDIHRSALRFPANRFFFFGTPMVTEGREGAKKGELDTLAAFKKDPYGCQGGLEEKREKRDPFARTVPYPAACPELSSLFSYCGTHYFTGKLPWNKWGSRKWLGGL